MQDAIIERLVEERVASRIHAKDATLYDFSAEARECAENFMGWADLPSNPPCPLDEIKQLAAKFAEEGIESVLLIGQGGSTQAAMTMTKFNKANSNIKFRVLDSDSPVRLRKTMAEINPRTTLVIVSSKSGGTLEMRSVFCAVRNAFAETMPTDEMRKHFVAITDPGSALEAQAKEEGWGGLLSGEPTVGGRFSALSVFGLFPAAAAGIDIDALVAKGLEAEHDCSEDSEANPAIKLAAFLYANWRNRYDKFSFYTQKRARALGLWIEQLVAESVGKNGVGVLPQLETSPLLLGVNLRDRAVITYRVESGVWDDQDDFLRCLTFLDPALPRMDYSIGDVEELGYHFVMWEYATAMLGYLMQVAPFDQPDVASVKAKVLDLLAEGLPEPDFVDERTTGIGAIEVRVSDCCKNASDVRAALYGLFSSVNPGDYFAINAFLPFDGYARKMALGRIRVNIAKFCNVMSCLEIGPRYMHSTGQLQKGGSNTGVYLLLSADEPKDIPLQGVPAKSLGELSKAQAIGDFMILSERGRRCLHLHLPDNSTITLQRFTQIIDEVLEGL